VDNYHLAPLLELDHHFHFIKVMNTPNPSNHFQSVGFLQELAAADRLALHFIQTVDYTPKLVNDTISKEMDYDYDFDCTHQIRGG
jgi:hypothetical protein